jgi:hypothetical protein
MAMLRRLDDGTPASSEGWAPVPVAFPGDGKDEGASERATDLIERGLCHLADRYGVDPAVFDEMAWIERGGRLWLHAAKEWPVGAWLAGGAPAGGAPAGGAKDAASRIHALGFRAIELDQRGEPRPTNDLLRLLGQRITRGALSLGRADLLRLLESETLAGPLELRGSVALRYEGEVLGRGTASGLGVRSEIPKQRAAELGAVLGRAADPGPGSSE